jgi:hypothetical protein
MSRSRSSTATTAAHRAQRLRRAGIASLTICCALGIAYYALFRAPSRGCSWASAPASLARTVLVQPYFRLSLEDLLGYGTCMGHRRSLHAAVDRCLDLPPAAVSGCVDGVAHGFRPEPGEDAAVLAEVLRVSPDLQPLLLDGLVRAWTIEAKGDPAAVLPQLATLPVEPTGYANGVRIGIQVGLGRDLPAAMVVGASWPEAYQEPIFEELGWRAGDATPDRPFQYAETAPPSAQLAYIQGAARGAALRVTDGLRPAEAVPVVNDLLRALSLQRPRDSAHIRLGVGVALLLRYPPGEARTETLRLVGLQTAVAHRERAEGVPIWLGPAAGPMDSRSPNIIF